MNNSGKNYTKMASMLLASFVIMYGVMFLNVAETSHIYISLTRTYMTLLMVAPMTLLMLTLMGGMYGDKKKNTFIAIGAVLVFVAALTGLRTQTPIGDVQYMKAMIPHHSSAIMVSTHANLKDPEVKKLAEDIIVAQEKEIAQMKSVLARMESEDE